MKVHTHKFDLKLKRPVWRYDHSYPDDIPGMQDLSPSSIEALANSIKDSDEGLAIMYQNIKLNQGTPILECDFECRL